MLMFYINYILLLICVLVSVAFITLFERKVLGYIQLRKGPNKVGVMGLFQPFSDAVKLFTKEQNFPYYSNFLPFVLAPVISFALSLLVWFVIPMKYNIVSFEFGILFFVCVIGCSVYSLLMGGWSSNSKYSLLGSVRAVAQTISYEIVLILILIFLMLMLKSFNFMFFLKLNTYVYIGLMFPLIFMLWLVIILAETNRTPFDFAEGESELVSGYNTEFSSGMFALLMLAEYASICFMSMVSILMFYGVHMVLFKVGLLIYFFLWVRGTFPRFRYDKLMLLLWKCYLPLMINLLIFLIGLIILFF
uniref:NADH dehydrogenase subunit 1 n=1 Tax=Lynceus grossipedia TaxID=2774322 RepID=UPI0023AA7204|nr:NADH dehydrogenase subunit 1 [Lynceus grossipedia]WCD23730.1 NADH dehydrogenase subunit 1 [Lynceus grossipedia]